ncbi:MAG: polysaccharide biosynthesis/export family protein [Vicinamibacterales bacterium]
MLNLLAVLLLLAPQNPSLTAEYIVGPQDRLAITVFDEPTLTKTVSVESDGSFEFPLVGRVKAGGLPVRQITADLRKRLGPPDGFLVNPQVNIEVETYRSQVVYVNGQVRVPGAIPLKGAMTIMDVLAQAGSPTPEAGPYVEVYRKPAGQASQGPLDPAKMPAPERVPMEDLRNGRAQQILLRDGDTLNVPKAQTFIVNGFVRTPNTFVLEGEVTVQRAIAMAGGVTERGTPSRTKIQRMVDGKLVEIKAKMTDLVQPNDTILVPQRFF